MKIDKIRNFLIMIKSIIVYVRSSPKRQAMFHALQAEHDSNSKSLRPFCPTRWCMRIKSLKTLYDNYLCSFNRVYAKSFERKIRKWGQSKWFS